jgi:hypothetical protein
LAFLLQYDFVQLKLSAKAAAAMANLNATCKTPQIGERNGATADHTERFVGVDFSLSGVVCYGVFFNYKKQPDNPFGVNCTSQDNFDPDVAGIGVRSTQLHIRERRIDRMK